MVDLESMVAKSARVQMYKKLVAKELTAGTGDFDAELVAVTLPEDLALPLEETQTLLTDAANERVKDSLVQAVSMLRQKQPDKVVSLLCQFSLSFVWLDQLAQSRFRFEAHFRGFLSAGSPE